MIEITKSATSTMLDKADDGDIAVFQAITVRNLDNNLSTESNIHPVWDVEKLPLGQL